LVSRKPDEAYPTSAFDYALPRDRIASHPAAQRDESRLMVLDRAQGAIEHRRFRDIVDYMQPGDALVLNDTKVFPARLLGKREGGGEAEVLLLRPLARSPARPFAESARSPDRPFADYEALVRPGTRLKTGRRVTISDELTVEILDATPDGGRIVRLHTPLSVAEALQRYGHMPLPPYIERADDASDRERYQTVYARTEGSVAAPTAGLHFTDQLLDQINDKGIDIIRILLHVGVGTFRPVEVDDPAQHVMHAESYTVTPEAADHINATRARGGKVWAVGTTVTRTLESVADDAGGIHPGSGATTLFIRPPYRFKAVDRLITNFHLPRSTLMMLVAAFGGYELVMRAYQEAIAGDYRFYSYGDSMLIR